MSANQAKLAENAFWTSGDPESLTAEALLSTAMISSYATSSECIRKVLATLNKLEAEPHINQLKSVLKTGLERFGEPWRYADLTSVLWSVSTFLKPQRYLEIGVRRGRSMAMVAATCPTCEIVGFDLWIDNYADVTNPGPDFVRTQIKQIHPQVRMELISGNSHATVPAYFQAHPDLYFDMITVDGDHSDEGARADLQDVITRLKVGGVLLFDDISHPDFPYLERVWQDEVAARKDFACWQFTDAGNGVAFAIRKMPVQARSSGMGHSLQDAFQQAKADLVRRGIHQIALYGAGQHTHRLLRSVDYSPLILHCIVDDQPKTTHLYNLPVIQPAEAGRFPLQALVISSDSAEEALAARARQWVPPGIEIVCLYGKK